MAPSWVTGVFQRCILYQILSSPDPSTRTTRVIVNRRKTMWRTVYTRHFATQTHAYIGFRASIAKCSVIDIRRVDRLWLYPALVRTGTGRTIAGCVGGSPRPPRLSSITPDSGGSTICKPGKSRAPYVSPSEKGEIWRGKFQCYVSKWRLLVHYGRHFYSQKRTFSLETLLLHAHKKQTTHNGLFHVLICRQRKLQILQHSIEKSTKNQPTTTTKPDNLDYLHVFFSCYSNQYRMIAQGPPRPTTKSASNSKIFFRKRPRVHFDAYKSIQKLKAIH